MNISQKRQILNQIQHRILFLKCVCVSDVLENVGDELQYIFFPEQSKKSEMSSEIKSMPPIIRQKITSSQPDISFQQAFAFENLNKEHFFFVKDSLVNIWAWPWNKKLDKKELSIRCEGIQMPFEKDQKEKGWQFIHSKAVYRIYGSTTFGTVLIRNHRNGTTDSKWLCQKMEYPSQYKGDHIQVRCSSQQLRKLIQGKHWRQLGQLIVRQQRSCQSNVVYFQDRR